MRHYIKLIILFICFISFDASAQRKSVGEWVQGFIIDNNQDTIHGILEVEEYELSEIRVKFKKKYGREFSKKKTYKPDDILGYSMKVRVNNNSDVIQEEWINYTKRKVMEAPRPFAGKTVFLQQRELGVINLYVYYIRLNSSANIVHYFILESANSKELIKVTEKNFDEVVKKYLKGCSQLRNRVGRADYSYLNLDRIIYFYNRCSIADVPSQIDK